MLPILTVFKNIGNFTGIKMLSSYKGVVFAYLGFGGSMSIFVLHGFIKGIPKELEEAAWIDGCSPEGTFFRIIMPLLRPVQMTVLILNGLWIWNDYLLPSIMLGLNGKIKTLPIAVSSFVGSYVKQWDLILSAAFLAMIPIVLLFLIAQKQIIQGMVDGAIK
jgi:ABC transporter, permease protein